MATVFRHGRLLLGERPAQAADEHRQALQQERQWTRMVRTQLNREARMHHHALSEIREGAARERHLHRAALRDNRWLMALAETILARRKKPR